MKLEHIGFYTLCDKRAQETSLDSRLWRCELILTNKCNFNCSYCRGLDYENDLPMKKAHEIINLWYYYDLKYIRFSGGEPTLYNGLHDLIMKCSNYCMKKIALSTNGYGSIENYYKLIKAGVNDISISLDACCADFGDKMSGGIKGSWKKVTENIKLLSREVYVTVGIVITEKNINDSIEIIKYAHSLGVADIRIIPSAQWNKELFNIKNISDFLLKKHPILRYRINNIREGRHIRGLKESDCNRCFLALDDMAVQGEYHYPCIIYMREKGKPIGKVSHLMRQERRDWLVKHNTHNDPICKNNCLDVCIDYNNKVKMFQMESK